MEIKKKKSWREKLLIIFSRKKFIGGKKCEFIKCSKCGSFDNMYREYGQLLFLGFIPVEVWWERKVCETCKNIQDQKINIPLEEEDT